MPFEPSLPDVTVRLQLYTPWNFHERTPGKFTFEGEADVERFLDIAQDLGLNVLLRVGPYICGEWDFGGFPWWLASSKVRPVQCSPHHTELDAIHLEDVALDVLLCQRPSVYSERAFDCVALVACISLSVRPCFRPCFRSLACMMKVFALATLALIRSMQGANNNIL